MLLMSERALLTWEKCWFPSSQGASIGVNRRHFECRVCCRNDDSSCSHENLIIIALPCDQQAHRITVFVLTIATLIVLILFGIPQSKTKKTTTTAQLRKQKCCTHRPLLPMATTATTTTTSQVLAAAAARTSNNPCRSSTWKMHPRSWQCFSLAWRRISSTRAGISASY